MGSIHNAHCVVYYVCALGVVLVCSSRQFCMSQCAAVSTITDQLVKHAWGTTTCSFRRLLHVAQTLIGLTMWPLFKSCYLVCHTAATLLTVGAASLSEQCIATATPASLTSWACVYTQASHSSCMCTNGCALSTSSSSVCHVKLAAAAVSVCVVVLWGHGKDLNEGILIS